MVIPEFNCSEVLQGIHDSPEGHWTACHIAQGDGEVLVAQNVHFHPEIRCELSNVSAIKNSGCAAPITEELTPVSPLDNIFHTNGIDYISVLSRSRTGNMYMLVAADCLS